METQESFFTITKGDKMELTEEQVKAIAEDLQTGFDVYLHIDTKEMKTIREFEELDESSSEWRKELKEIKKDPNKYLSFEKLDSVESFRLMSDFIGTVSNKNLREKLEMAIDQPKPGRNFNIILNNEPQYRQKWFDFRNDKYIEYVKTILELHNNKINL